MAFKSLAAVVAVALVALAPVQETNALSIVPVAHGSSFFSRTPHSGLTRRAAKAGKRCPKYRSGQPSSTTDLNSTSPTVSTTSHSESVPATSTHTTNNTPSSSRRPRPPNQLHTTTRSRLLLLLPTTLNRRPPQTTLNHLPPPTTLNHLQLQRLQPQSLLRPPRPPSPTMARTTLLSRRPPRPRPRLQRPSPPWPILAATKSA
ncbi:hypothetical protein BKA62DRAFT_106020 [Auriculariales sp. MPI-PUGE-AT-0066]|nr:hypothetical protein BKA62DRAFT_106020 [Auriculariales sp. MPI-PUGE-AT-0066]